MEVIGILCSNDLLSTPFYLELMKDKQLIAEKEKCYHCGELCVDELVVFDEKNFCCQGCKMVYEILDSNDLCNYYDLQNSPGITLKNRDFEQKFAYLENSEIQQKLLNFSSDNLCKVTLKIPAIHCSSCIWLLEHLDTLRPGIIMSRVNFVRKEVAIDFDPEIISLQTVVELLATLGYEPEINLGNATKSKKKKENRLLYLQIGVAGFCFGNVMLLSFPEYFGFEGVDGDVQRFISYVNIAFAIPVVFFSALGYFESAWKGLQQKYINIDVPIALGIITLFTRSLFEILTQSGPGYLDSLSGLVFFLLIGKWVQSKTYEGLSFERDYKSYFPLAITRIRDGESQIVEVGDLQEGDRIEVRNQEIIPADAVLLSNSASIDYSFVTGEAQPITKQQGDHIYAGGRQVGHSIQLDIIKPVSQSYLTQLWNKDTFNQESRYDSIIDRVSKYFTLAVLGIALLTGLFWWFVEPANILNSVTAVLIVACPCALALATPFTLGNAMAILGKNKLYLKHMNVLQNLWTISEIIFDKTGTLTRGVGAEITFSGVVSEKEKNLVAHLASQSTHPLSRAISGIWDSPEPVGIEDLAEIKGAGIRAVISGQLVKIGSAKFVGATESGTSAGSTVYVGVDGKSLGFFSVSNRYRRNLNRMMNNLFFKTTILSGDNASEEKNLRSMFPTITEMIFNQRPEEKLAFIEEEQNKGEDVLMLGDGLNDAGALKQANVGFAVTEDVTAFTPACDAILYGGNMGYLDRFLNFALDTKKVIYASFTISFLYNLVGLSLAVSANLTPLFAAILMPLSSVTVVAFATFTVRWIGYRRGL